MNSTIPFDVLPAAAKELNINVGNIHEVCAGKYGRKTAGSYKWKFAK